MQKIHHTLVEGDRHFGRGPVGIDDPVLGRRIELDLWSCYLRLQIVLESPDLGDRDKPVLPQTLAHQVRREAMHERQVVGPRRTPNGNVRRIDVELGGTPPQPRQRVERFGTALPRSIHLLIDQPATATDCDNSVFSPRLVASGKSWDGDPLCQPPPWKSGIAGHGALRSPVDRNIFNSWRDLAGLI